MSRKLVQTLNNALASLYAHLNASGSTAILGWEEVQEWQAGTLQALIDWGLLKLASAASSLECFGCEHRCYQEIILRQYPDMTRAFIICDMPEVQDTMGRINVPLERLNQWQCSAIQIAKVLQGLLGLSYELKLSDSGAIALGMMKDKKGRRWVTLKSKPLRLEINQADLSIENVVFVKSDELSIDRVRVDSLVNATERRQGGGYQSSTGKREAGKSKTEALHQSWKDAYLRLKRKNPYKTKTWCSQQIAKMRIANGRSVQTIFKNMQ